MTLFLETYTSEGLSNLGLMRGSGCFKEWTISVLPGRQKDWGIPIPVRLGFKITIFHGG